MAALALLSAVGCSTSTPLQRSREYLREGHVQLAFAELELEYTAQRAAGTVDDELAVAHQELYPRYLTERGRLAIYDDHELQGIELLEQVLVLKPGDVAALRLIDRARRKLANRAVQGGQECLVGKDLTRALLLFRQAQGYVHDHKLAAEGIEAVGLAIKQMHREAQEQYLEAIRKMPEFRFDEVNWHAGVAIARDESRDDAAKVRSRALRELADKAFEQAEDNKSEELFGAALMEYRSALVLFESMPEAVEDESRLSAIGEHIEHMKREVEAQAMVERALLTIKADRLDAARELLDQAQQLTSLQHAEINELRHEARKREGEMAYSEARDLELQGMKSEALAAFEAVGVDWPDGLLDEKTRIGALRSDIDSAGAEYAAGVEAEQEGDLSAALEHFQGAATFYERYLDVGDCIERVKKKIAGAGAATTGLAAARCPG